jgi:hypothetical protein
MPGFDDKQHLLFSDWKPGEFKAAVGSYSATPQTPMCKICEPFSGERPVLDPFDPQPIVVDRQIDGEWNDASEAIYIRDKRQPDQD